MLVCLMLRPRKGAKRTAERLAIANHAGGQLDTSQSLETLSTLSPKNLRFLVVSSDLSLVLFSTPLLALSPNNLRFLIVSTVCFGARAASTSHLALNQISLNFKIVF